MNKIHLLLAALLALTGCQNNKSDSVSIQNNSGKNPEIRWVNNNVIFSNDLPKIEIKVDEELSFVGKFDFEIVASSDEYSEDMQGKLVAAGERYVFVSVDKNRLVDRLFIVQFEGFLSENDLIYNYNFDNAERIGENKYRHNTWFYNSKIKARENPNSEGAKTRLFLEEKGIKLEDNFMMSRFVGLASEDRKNEIIIFYYEMLEKTTGYSLAEYEESISEEEAKSIRKSFIDRSRKSFNITKG